MFLKKIGTSYTCTFIYLWTLVGLVGSASARDAGQDSGMTVEQTAPEAKSELTVSDLEKIVYRCLKTTVYIPIAEKVLNGEAKECTGIGGDFLSYAYSFSHMSYIRSKDVYSTEVPKVEMEIEVAKDFFSETISYTDLKISVRNTETQDKGVAASPIYLLAVLPKISFLKKDVVPTYDDLGRIVKVEIPVKNLNFSPLPPLPVDTHRFLFNGQTRGYTQIRYETDAYEACIKQSLPLK